MLVTALLANSMAYAAAPADDLPSPATVHQKIQKRGLNKGVKLVLKDGSEVKGKVMLIGDEAVTVQVKQSSTPSVVPYAQIAEVKGPGLSTGTKIGIGVGAGVVVAAGIFAIIIGHELNKL